MNILDIIERVKISCGYDSDAALARALKMSPQNFNSQKRTGGIKDTLILHAIERGVNIDWIKTGLGNMFIAQRVAECPPQYEHSGSLAQPANGAVQHTPINHTRTESLLQKTARVIESTTPFAAALTSNIEAFHFGLELQTELSTARALLAEHSNTIHRLQESIDDMKKSQKNQKDELKSVRDELLCLEGRKTG